MPFPTLPIATLEQLMALPLRQLSFLRRPDGSAAVLVQLEDAPTNYVREFLSTETTQTCLICAANGAVRNAAHPRTPQFCPPLHSVGEGPPEPVQMVPDDVDFDDQRHSETRWFADPRD